MIGVEFKYSGAPIPGIILYCGVRQLCILWIVKTSQNPISVLGSCDDMVEDWHEWELPDDYRDEEWDADEDGWDDDGDYDEEP
jgi:hypothetical protein